MSLADQAMAAAQGPAFRTAMRLSPRSQLRLSGGEPVMVDGQVLEPEIQLFLKMLALNAADPTAATPEAARAFADGTAAMVAGPPDEMAWTRDFEVAGAEGPLRARLYVPRERAEDEASPLLVFFHGGGFVIGGFLTHDAPCRTLAAHGGVRVVSVEYRLAPEHPFPAAPQDCLAAFNDIVARAGELGADPERIAVGGDSAGGALSAVTCIQARDGGGPQPCFQLLIYPVTDMSEKSRSYHLFKEGFFLTEAQMDWYGAHYMTPEADHADPLISPLLAPSLEGLPPAHVVTAGFDPLRDEGESYAARLEEAGVPTTLRRHPGLIHGFINMMGTGRAARAATVEMAGVLRQALQA
ncbi:MAG: alpha/beta hydrolase [Solirubrobacteraceae bacterium]|nr:alpha/beta hydrolase [Solirubrobacteraceae bacterium]